MQMVQSANVIEGLGIEGDKHASAASKRQVLLADKEALDVVGVLPGTIKENVTVEGVDVMQLPAGSRVRLGRSANHRSEEHTSELQSQSNLVCRLLLEKKKKKKIR